MELPGREPRIVKHVRHALPSAPTHAATSIATTTTSSSGGGSSSDAALPVVTRVNAHVAPNPLNRVKGLPVGTSDVDHLPAIRHLVDR